MLVEDEKELMLCEERSSERKNSGVRFSQAGRGKMRAETLEGRTGWVKILRQSAEAESKGD